MSTKVLGIYRPATTGGDNFAAAQKIVRHRDSLIEQPARIVSQIDHISAQAGANLLFQGGDGILQAAIRLLREGPDANIANVALAFELHAFDADDGARQ